MLKEYKEVQLPYELRPFLAGHSLAKDVMISDILWITENKFIEIDDIDEEFINDEVSELYGDEDEVLPEHTKYTFYYGFNGFIKEIPHNAPCAIHRLINLSC